MFGLVVRWLKSPKIELLHNEAANVFPYELIFFLTNTEMNIQNIYIFTQQWSQLHLLKIAYVKFYENTQDTLL